MELILTVRFFLAGDDIICPRQCWIGGGPNWSKWQHSDRKELFHMPKNCWLESNMGEVKGENCDFVCSIVNAHRLLVKLLCVTSCTNRKVHEH